MEDVRRIGSDEYFLLHDNKSHHGKVIDVNIKSKTVVLEINSIRFTCQIEDDLDLTIQNLNLNELSGQVDANLVSTMPGLVLQVLVHEDQTIKSGTPLMILEAMKMENILKASHDGRVKEICCKPGDAVDKNQLLIEIEAD